MRTLVIGLGTQGNKRKKFCNKDYVASVDPFNTNAEYKYIEDVPISDYDAVIIATPDDQKEKILKYCLKNNKHILIEKPLIFRNITEIQKLANKKKLIVYSAYNHRFEPHIIKMKNILNSKKLGKIYSCRIFYGNGTSALVRKDKWRDKRLGVINDLGPHLFDLCDYWFNAKKFDFKLYYSNKFENNSNDHANIINKKNILINLEMTYLMWKNTFNCDIIGSKGSAHINCLCKWGPSIFTYRIRKYPSGIPKEKKIILRKKDPTWKLEYNHFKKLINYSKPNNLQKDKWILKQLKKIA